jgi:hypothetical protein
VTVFHCPHCELPLSPQAIDAGGCPCCGLSLSPPSGATVPVAEQVPAQAPLAEGVLPESGRLRFPARLVAVWFTAAVLVIGTGVLAYWLASPAGEGEVTNSEPPAPVQAPPKDTPPKAPAVAIAPPPHEPTVVTPPLPTEVAVAPEPRPKPAPRVEIVGAFDGPKRAFNLPNGTVEVTDLDGEDKLALTGKVKTLRIGALNGEAVLDASQLDAEEIVLAGDINGSTVLKVSAPNGRVVIAGSVNGSARLTIQAPGGEVVVAGENANLTGGTTMVITAKRADFRALLNGGTRVDVTLTSGGSLRTAKMDGGATVRYKPASTTDPVSTIETGELRGGATVKPAM